MKLSKQIFLAFFVVLALSVVDSFTNYMFSLRVKGNSSFLNKSEAIIRNSTALHKDIIEMQSAFRGYLLTNDSSFLNIYKEQKGRIPIEFNTLHKIIEEDTVQEKLLDSINSLHQAWIIYSDSLVQSRKESSVSEASRQLYTRLFENKLRKKIGKDLNDKITQKFARFDRTEYRQRNTRSYMLLSSITSTHTYSFAFLSLTIIVGVFSMVYIVRLISRRISSLVQQAESITHGNFSIVNDSHRDELTALSASMNIMSRKLSENISELETQNAELNQFAYVVSHDLKAPLRGIHNVVQWVLEDLGDKLGPELKAYFDIIQQRTRRMEDLINGILAYARTREKTAYELVDLHDMLKEITEALVPRTFKVDLVDLPKIYTDRIKLEQVFTNLVSNAVKAVRRPLGHIIVSCHEFGAYYKFSVSDNGIGISPEYHEKIFEIFQTLREKGEEESTGIGLAITKKILDDKQCRIEVNSDSGAGATFTFTWPRIDNIES